MDTTAHDLKLLSIGYFIQGGITLCYGLLFFCYVSFAGAMIAAVQRNVNGGGRIPIPAGLLDLILALVIAATLAMVVAGACMLYAGVALRKRRHRMLILVMAALNCLSLPYGTVLGIFTFMVMQRPAAKEIFGLAPAPLPPPRESCR
jgi:hypothetical protein